MAVTSTNRVLDRFSSMARGPLRHLSPIPTSKEGMDYVLFALTVSAVSYVVYNVLFLAAQLWAAFATLILGAYYTLLFYGRINKKNVMFMIGAGIQGLVTLIIFGLFLFFVAEIFVDHSLVYNVFTYTRHMSEQSRIKVARLTSVGMALDSLVTAALHLWALVLCCRDLRENAVKPDAPFEAMAIHTDLYYPEGRGVKSDAPYGAKPTYMDPYLAGERRRSSPHDAYRKPTPEESNRARDSMFTRLGYRNPTPEETNRARDPMHSRVDERTGRDVASDAHFGAMTTHTDPYFAEERGGTSDAPFRAMATHTDPYFPEERRSSPHEAFRNVTPEERSRARDSMLARLDESKYDSMSRFGLPRFQGWSSGGFSGGLRANARVEPYQSKPTLSYY